MDRRRRTMGARTETLFTTGNSDMHETLFDGDARTRFLSAFEDADVLCPEKASAATPPDPHAREHLRSDWALLFGAKAADL